jgi:hypothetical protein
MTGVYWIRSAYTKQLKKEENNIELSWITCPNGGVCTPCSWCSWAKTGKLGHGQMIKAL